MWVSRLILILAHRSVAASSHQIITAKNTVSYILYGIVLVIVCTFQVNIKILTGTCKRNRLKQALGTEAS